jgi:hypothetical protein
MVEIPSRLWASLRAKVAVRMTGDLVSAVVAMIAKNRKEVAPKTSLGIPVCRFWGTPLQG